MENIATAPDATIDCIDTFGGGIEHSGRGIDMNAVQQRFESNTARWKDRIMLHVGNSATILPNLSGTYDLIYIDGSHTACDVLTDAVLAWRLARDGAIIIFDDYAWPKYLDQPWMHPKLAVDSFLSCFAGWHQPLHTGYQVAVRKLARFAPPAQESESGAASASRAATPTRPPIKLRFY